MAAIAGFEQLGAVFRVPFLRGVASLAEQHLGRERQMLGGVPEVDRLVILAKASVARRNSTANARHQQQTTGGVLRTLFFGLPQLRLKARLERGPLLLGHMGGVAALQALGRMVFVFGRGVVRDAADHGDAVGGGIGLFSPAGVLQGGSWRPPLSSTHYGTVQTRQQCMRGPRGCFRRADVARRDWLR